jgi:ubiquinone/menaquinone biosynthesis C-methylase UbiE
MRTKRIENSTKEVDELERQWWNSNAETIEKIWAQSFSLQKIVRVPYLEKMKKFFLNSTNKRPLKILEIGCGSGWVCRLVADKDFHIIGTDFSEAQIALAKEMAARQEKEEYCSYEVADASAFEKDVDGVVIHALLHHLSENELQNFFRQFAEIKKGVRVFMYEPVFLDKQPGKAGFFDRAINKVIHEVKMVAIKKAKKTGHEDVKLNEKIKKIFNDAQKNGWYISPKEVPFYEKELDGYMKPLCTLQKKYIVNRSDLEIAEILAAWKIEKPGFLFSGILIPLVRQLDKISFKGKFTHYLPANQHVFVCSEWVKN